MGLTKEQILGKVRKSVADLPREKVYVEAWGGDVWLRALTASERDELEFESAALRKAGEEPLIGIRGRIVAWSMCDEEGKRILNSSDGALLGNEDAATLETLFDVAARLSGFGERAIADLEKNSKGTSSDSSATS